MTKGVKVLEGDKQFFILEILNFLSSRSSFFTISVKRKGFTNPFLRFLDFFSKSTEVS